MRKAYAIVLAGLSAVAIAGAAVAASRDTHMMNVPLPDGSIARVEYVGPVAPNVTVMPAPVSPFGLFDRSMFDIERQLDAMVHEVDAMVRMPAALLGVPEMNVVAYGNAPEGSSSVTVVSTSNGSKTCTRTTEVTGQGAGKPPRVVTSVGGDCGPAPDPARAKPTA